jgi:3-dehydroquinate synthase
MQYRALVGLTGTMRPASSTYQREEASVKSVWVTPGSDAPYQVLIGGGLLANAGRYVVPLLPNPAVQVAIVADETTAGLHASKLMMGLGTAGITASLVTVPAGEAAKSFEKLAQLTDRLLELGLDRGALLVALGGGVVGDLTGLAAALYMRGIGYVQAPTTLLAQVDSSVGGKTAINTPRGKNVVGAFHQPRLVLADTAALSTLPSRQMAAGYAEMVKVALACDADFFDSLEADGAAMLTRPGNALKAAIAHAVFLKAEIVKRDPRDNGQRALLNLGHTFGHALEAETGFGDALLHGEAVAVGCVLALKLSVRLGLGSKRDAARAATLLAKANLPTSVRDVRKKLSAERLLVRMTQDKKAEAGQTTFVLARAIGKGTIVRDVSPNVLESLLYDDGAE